MSTNHTTPAHCHVTCVFLLLFGADRDTVDDVDALGTNWWPPKEVGELLQGCHITVQVRLSAVSF